MPTIPAKSRFINAKAAAKIIGCSPSHARLLARQKILPAIAVPLPSGGFQYDILEKDAEYVRDLHRPSGRPRGSKAARLGVKSNLTKFPGYYVYGWYNSDSALPFYVGCGFGYRASVTHMDGLRKASCQLVREASNEFRILVYVYGADEPEALLIEKVMINAIKLAGGCKCNTSRVTELPEFLVKH